MDDVGRLVGWVIREGDEGMVVADKGTMLLGEVTMVPGEGTMLLGEVTMVPGEGTVRNPSNDCLIVIKFVRQLTVGTLETGTLVFSIVFFDNYP